MTDPKKTQAERAGARTAFASQVRQGIGERRAFKSTVSGFSSGVKGFTPGQKTLPKAERKESLLEKLQTAERQLASIKTTDENAKWTLARMRSKQMFIDTNDTDYWICICFESHEQKEEFLRQSGLEQPDEDKYFSGLALAKAMKIPLARDRRAFHTLSVNQRWEPYAMPDPTGEAPAQSARRDRSSGSTERHPRGKAPRR